MAEFVARLLKMGAVIEPAGEIDASKCEHCGCECDSIPFAANMLHFWRSKWLELASCDAELHTVICAWERLSTVTRKAIVAFAAGRDGNTAGSCS
jgi:hypothetical protein